MGGMLVTEALRSGLVDELVLHQVPILLGAGRRCFHDLPEHIELRPIEVVPAGEVTQLRFHWVGTR